LSLNDGRQRNHTEDRKTDGYDDDFQSKSIHSR
jgi:hypothetical protein